MFNLNFKSERILCFLRLNLSYFQTLKFGRSCVYVIPLTLKLPDIVISRQISLHLARSL